MPGRPVAFSTPRLHGLVVILLLIGSMLVPRTAASQDVRYLRHGSWSTENGLPQNSVHQVLQTKDGFLWIATEGGIARFDGVTFTIFSHDTEPAFASNDTCCLAEDARGDLWIGTNDGLLRLRRGVFERFSERDGLPSASIERLQSIQGKLFVQTSSGIVEHEDDRFQQRPATAMDDPETSDLASERLRGLVWTMSDKAIRLTAPGLSRQWSVSADLPGSRIESLYVDRRGNAWIGTNDGLAVLTQGDDKVQNIGFLRGNSVLQTYQDREGNYWVGTETTGLHLLTAQTFRDEPALANQALTSVTQSSDGSIWVGTRKDGLRRLRNGRVESPVHVDALTSPFILSLAAGQHGDVWAGTPDGLNHVDAAGKVLRATSANMLPDDYIRALAQGRDGAIWIGTRRGLVRMQGNSRRVFTRADGLGADLIGALLSASNGDIWAGTSGGLSRLAADGQVSTYTTKDGLSSPIVSALAEAPAGTIWIATSDGQMSRLKDNRIAPVPRTDLQAGVITSMLPDRDGFLWLRGARFVDRVAVTELNRCVEGGLRCALSVARYSTADGMPSSEVFAGGSPLLWQMKDGEVWLATKKGAAIATGGPLSAAQPFPVVIERLVVDGSEQNLQHGTLSLAPGDSRIDVEYAGLSYVAPLQVTYRYRLDGFDRDWTNAGNRRLATYTNLPPRSYTFRVTALGSDGRSIGTEATVTFRVRPAVYRRWWFVLLVILFAVAAGVSLYRLRVRRLRRQFDAVLAERNRLAREIHDTLAQDFVAVTLQLDLVTQALASGRSEDATQQLRSTRKLVTDGLADARRSIWELRASTSKDSLPTRLAALIDRYAGPSLAIHLKVGGAYRQLQARTEEGFLRIAQEALSNVQRHSGAARANVELHFGTDMLVMTVTDKGRGFTVGERAVSDGHYGVSGMHERAAALGATLLIVSGPLQGTALTLRANIAGSERKQSG